VGLLFFVLINDSTLHTEGTFTYCYSLEQFYKFFHLVGAGVTAVSYQSQSILHKIFHPDTTFSDIYDKTKLFLALGKYHHTECWYPEDLSLVSDVLVLFYTRCKTWCGNLVNKC